MYNQVTVNPAKVPAEAIRPGVDGPRYPRGVRYAQRRRTEDQQGRQRPWREALKVMRATGDYSL